MQRQGSRGQSVLPVEGDFSKDLVAVFSYQPVDPIAKRLHKRKGKQPGQDTPPLQPRKQREKGVQPTGNPAIGSDQKGGLWSVATVLWAQQPLGFLALIRNHTQSLAFIGQPLEAPLGRDAHPAAAVID